MREETETVEVEETNSSNSTGNFTTQKRLTEIAFYDMPDMYKKITINYIEKINFLTKKLQSIEKDMLW